MSTTVKEARCLYCGKVKPWYYISDTNIYLVSSDSTAIVQIIVICSDCYSQIYRGGG